LFKQVLLEKVEPMMQSMKTQVSIPATLKKTIASLLHLTGSPKAADLLNATGGRSVDELYELVDRRNTLKHQILCEWKALGLDAVLCVAGLLPAIPHESFSNVSFAAAPFMLFNVLDLPTGVVPVTRVAADDVWTSSAVDLLESRCHAAYNPAAQAGLPVGVQVVALPFQEETCLRAMKATAQAVNFSAASFA
jgi:Asp-tRNA(Asn)/Glu-tRNA(Gln) amidotransferase A subunit family amidase